MTPRVARAQDDGPTSAGSGFLLHCEPYGPRTTKSARLKPASSASQTQPAAATSRTVVPPLRTCMKTKTTSSALTAAIAMLITTLKLPRERNELPQVAAALGAYVPAVRTGNLVYTSGQLPITAGRLMRMVVP